MAPAPEAGGRTAAAKDAGSHRETSGVGLSAASCLAAAICASAESVWAIIKAPDAAIPVPSTTTTTVRFIERFYSRAHETEPQRYSGEMTTTSVLQPGVPAPDFSLPSTPDQRVSLSEFRGQPVILAFYPADWSPVCGDQMALYNEILGEFQRFDAELIGISVDGIWCHLAFAHDRKLRFPLLADFEPKGHVARQYGVYREHEGTTERALFVIDAGGVIRWSHVSPVGINPGADGILRALEALQTGASNGASR